MIFNSTFNNISVISWRSVLLVDFDFWCFNATFSNISAISWRPVLVKKPEYPERTTDHGQATGKLYHLQLRVECTLFCSLESPCRIGDRLV